MSPIDARNEIEDSAAPLIEHLAELRTRLIYSVMAFLVGIVLAFTVAQPILNFLLDPIIATLKEMGDPDPKFQTTSPQEYLFTLFRISMVFGFALAFPVIGFQMWRFVAPGLYRAEKNAFLPFLAASPLMFLLGASFAHFVVTPLAMQFFLGFVDVSTVLTQALSAVVDTGEGTAEATTDNGPTVVFLGKVNESLDITLKFIIAFGLCFQLPVLLTLMGKAGLVSAQGLGAVRKYAMVGILVLAAVVTPPDVVTQLILFTVVYGLYEVSIFLVARVEKKREAELRAQGLWFEEDEDEDGADRSEDPFGEAEADEDPLLSEFDEGKLDRNDAGDDPGAVNKS